MIGVKINVKSMDGMSVDVGIDGALAMLNAEGSVGQC